MASNDVSDRVRDIARRAGSDSYRDITETSFGDSENGLRYMVARLSGTVSMGLEGDDRRQLGEIASIAISGQGDLERVAEDIRARESAAHPLLLAVADILQQSGNFGTTRRTAAFGALFGAYLMVGSGLGLAFNDILKAGGYSGILLDDALLPIIGAIAGAVATTSLEFVRNRREDTLWFEFSTLEEPS